MSKLFYIKKLVRDDKSQLVFDQNEIYLDEKNSLLARPQIETSKVEYTEADGGEMVAQRLMSGEQTINGLIIRKTTDYWTLRNRLTAFFQTNHTYFIVYEKISGETLSAGAKFKTGTAWIEENLQVYPEPKEDYSRWSVTLGIGSAGFQEYAENEQGEETFAHSVSIGLATASSGGQDWDAVGQEWDSVGSVWETGDGGLAEIAVQSTIAIYPTIVISGEAVNPSIRNNTNNTIIEYNGTVAASQTLTIDLVSGTASLNGVNVTRNLSGSMSMVPGSNLLGFEIDSGTATQATIKWNNFIQ